MKKLIRNFWCGEEAASLVEYALLVALIALACILAVTAAGGQIAAIFNYIANNLPVPA